MNGSVDPITTEVIRNALQSTARQMRNVLIRSSFNPMIYEMVDFSLGIYSAEGELVAEGPGIPFFMGALTFTIREVVNYLGRDTIVDGDVILCTYPYWTGSHSQDAVTIQPVFHDGSIVAFTAVKAHWLDLGAKDYYGIDTTDIWQEGLQLFGVKVVKAGILDREIVEIIRANSRMPDVVIGDMNGQISACGRGAEKVKELIGRYGADHFHQAIAHILDHGEAVARAAIAALPDGEWVAEAAMDSNGLTDDPVPIRLRVRIAGDHVHVDTEGSAPQQAGPINSPFPSTVSGVRLVMKMLLAPHYDANEGFFRPISVSSPPGSLFNPDPPAPVFLYGWSALVMGEAMFQAMLEACPDRSVARSGGDLAAMVFSGHEADGQPFAGGSDECCGQGASRDQDGENALIVYALGESRNVPVEVLEQRYPLLVEEYALWEGSAGAGRTRGGLGVRKRWKALADISMIAVMEQTKSPAWGVDGGHAGRANELVARPGSPAEERLTKIAGYWLAAGDCLEVRTGGGGGWGDPRERDRDAVRRDVLNGYVSEADARIVYGYEGG